ncbi:hypothetical protein E2C01_022533 [Portunus trituberculatus]|uniref:Uncharacterized protein n=1 Tax=Portunus trituberculatus TaxID=210409 RepID=A0A5B7E7I6_PORTR|nr:hypothetical protein [Portunus trituberculatus]
MVSASTSPNHTRRLGLKFSPTPINQISNKTHLELNDPLLAKTQIHPLRVLHVKRTLVKLGHWVVCIQERCLLVHLANDEPGQCHPRHGTHQLHRGAIVDVAVTHAELLTLTLIVIH